MQHRSVLITGGAGFVGSNIAIALAERYAGADVVVFDNLRRRGSALNLDRLASSGVRFVHGDIRCTEDLAALPPVDLVIDCAAEPSVLAGVDGGADYVVRANLLGTANTLEFARRHGAAFLFLSTSRVYPIAALEALPYRETETRFEWGDLAGVPGVSARGVAENFGLDGARSLYGASKLASELLIAEYVHLYGMRALVNRCGILTGPWQMGKTDQGVVALWVARHAFGGTLSYIGFGGTGKQVRDMLHIDDLVAAVVREIETPEIWDGRVYNVGGGPQVSASLLELTDICRETTGNLIPIGSRPETSSVDVRVYLTDAMRIESDLGWRPQRTVEDIVADTYEWLLEHSESLEAVLV